MNNQHIRYNLITHSAFSHTFLIQELTSNDLEFRFEKLENEESYSRFEVYGSSATYKLLRDLVELNNGTLQYGAY
jgi:hypothetical protein